MGSKNSIIIGRFGANQCAIFQLPFDLLASSFYAVVDRSPDNTLDVGRVAGFRFLVPGSWVFRFFLFAS